MATRSYAPKWDYEPTGVLSLKIDSWATRGIRKEWNDSKSKGVEDHLKDFLINLVTIADLEKNIANLWAATGWFLERFQKTFHVPDPILARMERRRPRSKQYLERGRRGGILAKRWNLILPKEVFELGEPDER